MCSSNNIIINRRIAGTVEKELLYSPKWIDGLTVKTYVVKFNLPGTEKHNSVEMELALCFLLHNRFQRLLIPLESIR